MQLQRGGGDQASPPAFMENGDMGFIRRVVNAATSALGWIWSGIVGTARLVYRVGRCMMRIAWWAAKVVWKAVKHVVKHVVTHPISTAIMIYAGWTAWKWWSMARDVQGTVATIKAGYKVVADTLRPLYSALSGWPGSFSYTSSAAAPTGLFLRGKGSAMELLMRPGGAGQRSWSLIDSTIY